MLDFNSIKQSYPNFLQKFEKNILREYLQYKILESIYESKYANKLIFLGETALRIVHQNQRFSEDLDFDNLNVTQKDFENITQIIKKSLEKEGFQVEMRNVCKGAFHCYIKFPELLFKYKLTPQKREKIFIRLDTVPQHFNCKPQTHFLNKFDVFTQILVEPLDVLLSQKIFAILNRKTAKGRDFFDIVFLLSKTKPNYDYLLEKIEINSKEKLKTTLLDHCKKLDLKKLAKDVEPFLFKPSDTKKILMFTEYLQQIEL